MDAPTQVVAVDQFMGATKATRHLTVRQEFLEVGTPSMAMLLRRLRGELDGLVKRVVEPDLVVRAGTAPPR